MTTPLLAVRGLEVAFPTPQGMLTAVDGLTFELRTRETLAVVGESGAGKSAAALAIMGLLPTSARVRGSIVFAGRDLATLTDAEMRHVRGNGISMVFQDSTTALNPVYTVRSQIVEAVRVHHRRVSRRAASRRAVDLLDLVGIADPGRRADDYPHQLSGGMRQRVMIAMAIANEPELLIADEPTSSMDVTVQAQVMEAMRRAQDATGAGMLLITHDLGLVAGVATRVQVMYGGRLFEVADTPTLFERSRNPYTRELLASTPSRAALTGEPLRSIPGAPPDALRLAEGCVFHPRCRFATAICAEAEPRLEAYAAQPGHLTRCHHADALPDRFDGSVPEAAG